MNKKKLKIPFSVNLISAVILLTLYKFSYSGVPSTQTHRPSIPYFMEQIQFQSILLGVFGENMSGVVPDKYSDLNWNPAYIFNNSQDGVYIDFNYQKPVDSYYQYYNYGGNDMVVPNWYYNTYVTSLQTDPLYNLAFVKKINSSLSIGIFNRSLFDYGPYRSISDWHYYSYGRNLAAYDESAYKDLELKTVEVANNQQGAWGTQTEISVGYKMTSKIDLGLKFGHYIFRRWGDLYDSRYSKQPHSLIDEYNNEDLTVDGDQLEFGAGIVYHINENTDIGLFASYMDGKATEQNTSIDKTEYWSERATDTRYYSISDYYLFSNYSNSSEGRSPFVSLTFQKKLSPDLTLRSFFSYRQREEDIGGSIFSMDTTYKDRTYDYYSSGSYYFTRDESFGDAETHLGGDGKEDTKLYKWFTSLIYNPQNEWSAFAAIILQMQNLNIDIYENSTHYRNDFRERFYYDIGTLQNYHSYIKHYQYSYASELWSAIIPVGVKAGVFSGFSLLIGTDLKFELTKTEESGDMLYPQRITRRTENGIIIVEDIETNRPETYNSDQPKEFHKSSGIHFGAFYEHKTGINIYIKTGDDILEKNGWSFGVEYIF